MTPMKKRKADFNNMFAKMNEGKGMDDDLVENTATDFADAAPSSIPKVKRRDPDDPAAVEADEEKVAPETPATPVSETAPTEPAQKSESDEPEVVVPPKTDAAPVEHTPEAPTTVVAEGPKAEATPEGAPAPVKSETPPEPEGQVKTAAAAAAAAAATDQPNEEYDIFGERKPVAERKAQQTAIKKIVGNAQPEKHTSGAAVQAIAGPPLGAGGIVTAGDDDSSQQVQPGKPTKPSNAGKFQIPGRPDLWPYYMSWPRDSDVKRLSAPGVTDEQREEYFKRIQQLPLYMVKRAKLLEQWMEEEGQGATLTDRGFMPGWKRHLENTTLNQTQTDPFKQIHWASLLDPMSDPSTKFAKVTSWSKMRARTIDGGEVLAGPQSVSVTKTSQAALELAIDEGIARGWKSHKLQGSPEFCEMAIKIARERGITAEIKVTGPKGLFKRPIHVMPNVPPPDPDIVKQITSSTAKEEDPKAAKAAAALAPEDDTDPMGGGMTQQEYIERQNAEKREEEEAQKRKADAEPDGLEM